jgi:type I restriction enzyme S subunit
VSFPRYPDYFESGEAWLGAVPSHWTVTRLKNLLKEIDERAGQRELELLGLSKSAGVVRRSELNQGSAAAEDYGKYKVVRPGNLVMNKMQAWNGVFAISQWDGIVSPDYTVFEFLTDGYDALICATLRTGMAAGELFTRCRGMGTAFLRLNTGDFLTVRVALPPLAEAGTIAAFLDREIPKIDALVEEQRELVELLNQKRRAVIFHAVTKGLDAAVPMKDSGVEWLGEVPAHWDVLALKRLVCLQSGEAITSECIEETGDFPVYGANGLRGYTDRFTNEGEFILIGRQGALCGNVNYASGQFWATDSLVAPKSSAF